jgi:hypothetical protein
LGTASQVVTPQAIRLRLNQPVSAALDLRSADSGEEGVVGSGLVAVGGRRLV